MAAQFDPQAQVAVAVQNVRAALAAIHAPTANPEMSRQAQAALDALKASLSVQDALVLGASFLSPLQTATPAPLSPDDEYALHFGFHVMDERALLPDWVTVAREVDRLKLRNMALSIVTLVARPEARTCFPKWVQQKAAALVAALAMREWPQVWESFVEDLSGVVSTNPGSKDIACEIFKALSDDVHEFGDRVSSSRRAELSKGLITHEELIMEFVRDCVVTFLAAKDYHRLTGALKTIESVLSWCDMAKAMKNGTVMCLLDVMKSLLVDEEARCVEIQAPRDAALEALTVFVSRKVPACRSVWSTPKEEAAILIRDQLFPSVLAFVRESRRLVCIIASSELPICEGYFSAAARLSLQDSLQAEVHDAKLHDFRVRFVRMLSALGRTHFGLCFLPHLTEPVDLSQTLLAVATAYIDLMLACSAHCSMLMKADALLYFSSMFFRRKKKLQQEAAHGSLEAAMTTSSGAKLLHGMALGVANACSLALVKRIDPMATKYASLDFEEDESDFKEVQMSTQQSARVALSAATVCFPGDLFSLAIVRLKQAIDMCVDARQNGAPLITDETQVVTAPSARQFVRWISYKGQRHTWELVPITSVDQGPALLSHAQAFISAADSTVVGCCVDGVLQVESGEDRDFFVAVFDTVAGMSDVQLQGLKVSALKLFVQLVVKDNSRLRIALEQLVSLALAEGETSHARKVACLSLNTLIRRVGKASKKSDALAHPLASTRDKLCELVDNALIQPNRSTKEKCNLLEAALTCILTHKELATQTTLVDKLLMPICNAAAPTQVWCQNAFVSPASVMNFAVDSNDVPRLQFLQALALLQVATHELARGSIDASVAPVTVNSLSRSRTANLCLDLAEMLVPLLHGLYDPVKNPALADPRAQAALLPTVREISAFLSGEESFIFNSLPAPDLSNSGILLDEEVLERCNDRLRRVGIQPPDAGEQSVPETFRFLRLSAYELFRNCIVSGKLAEPSSRTRILNAVYSSHQHAEPLHLYYMTHRIVRFMLSYAVVGSDVGIAESLSSSPVICSFLALLNECIESLSMNGIVTTYSSALGFSQEQGKLLLCGVAAHLIEGLYPKNFRFVPGQEFFAPILLHGNTSLSGAIWVLMRTLCGPGVASACPIASRKTSILIANFVQAAPSFLASQFASLVVTCLRTAVFNYGRDGDDAFIIAVVELSRRFPAECTRSLGEWIQTETSTVQERIKSDFSALLTTPGTSRKGPSVGKKLIRSLVKFISEQSQLTIPVAKKVRALPTDRVRKKAAPTCDEEELILNEHALDSLFGDGPPL